MSHPKLTPQIAFNLAERLYEASGERDERLEGVIAQDAWLAYLYAKDVLKGPFYEGEPVIAQDPQISYDYAKDALKGPFPEGEPAIAQDPQISYEYARDVKGPWSVVDDMIIKFPHIGYLYSRDVLRQRVPSRSEWAFYHALHTLKSPWPEAEALIAGEQQWAYAYNRWVKGILPEQELLMDVGYSCKTYTREKLAEIDSVGTKSGHLRYWRSAARSIFIGHPYIERVVVSYEGRKSPLIEAGLIGRGESLPYLITDWLVVPSTGGRWGKSRLDYHW
jgi:hypothetical protein